MTEWQAIGWVFGGVVSVVSFTIAIINFLKKHDEKIRAETREEVKEESSLDANWKETRKLRKEMEEFRELIAVTNELVQSTNELVQRLTIARNEHIKKEELKYDTCRFMVEHHQSEHPKFKHFLERYVELEAEERKKQNQPIKFDVNTQ